MARSTNASMSARRGKGGIGVRGIGGGKKTMGGGGGVVWEGCIVQYQGSVYI